MNFENRLLNLKNQVDQFTQDYLGSLRDSMNRPGLEQLYSAMEYSVVDGGQRIRPLLSLLTAETLGKNAEEVLPFGVAVEFIHSYSLIHDDLPCMDDDDERRNKPSNHKKFGEALAVLSGDALNTEAFFLLSQNYGAKPQLALDLVSDLALAAGARGMAGGQAADVVFKERQPDGAEIEFLHMYKTGALFRASILGAARICEANAFQLKCLSDYARAFGLVFQIADDIADGENSDEPSFVRAVGLEKAKATCGQLIETGHDALKVFENKADGLKELISSLYKRV